MTSKVLYRDEDGIPYWKDYCSDPVGGTALSKGFDSLEAAECLAKAEGVLHALGRMLPETEPLIKDACAMICSVRHGLRK